MMLVSVKRSRLSISAWACPIYHMVCRFYLCYNNVVGVVLHVPSIQFPVPNSVLSRSSPMCSHIPFVVPLYPFLSLPSRSIQVYYCYTFNNCFTSCSSVIWMCSCLYNITFIQLKLAYSICYTVSTIILLTCWHTIIPLLYTLFLAAFSMN